MDSVTSSPVSVPIDNSLLPRASFSSVNVGVANTSSPQASPSLGPSLSPPSTIFEKPDGFEEAEPVKFHLAAAEGDKKEFTKEAPAEERPRWTHWGSSLMPGPPCVRNIVGNELCERYSYYGLRAILVLFATNQLGFSDADAVSLSSYSSSVAYFMPLIGGFVADSYLGKYNTIFYFSWVYVAGSILLACSAINNWSWMTILALCFIAFGTGGIKPCVSSFGADQFMRTPVTTPEAIKQREHDVSSFFHFFYFAINLGSVGSFLVTPLMRNYCGYSWAFSVPAFLLTIALGIFWTGRKDYYRSAPQGSMFTPLYYTYKSAFTNRKAEAPVVPPTPGVTALEPNWIDKAIIDPSISASQVADAKALWRVMPIFSVLPIFWMLFDQQSSSWILQAEEMELYGISSDQIGIVNPIVIMIFLPIFDKYVYPTIARMGYNFTLLRRMGVGMIVSVFAFLLSAGVQYLIESASTENSVSVMLQLPQIFLISIAEILVSVTSLEFAYTEATPALKSSISAIYLVTVAVGDLLVAVLYDALSVAMSESLMYVVFACLMVGNFFAFLWVASFYPTQAMTDPSHPAEEGAEDKAVKALEAGNKHADNTKVPIESINVELSSIVPPPENLERASTISYLPQSSISEAPEA